MTTLWIDPHLEEEELRLRIYDGDLILRTSVDAVWDLVRFARAQLTELFRPHDPEEAHLHFSPEQVASMLATWKPAFIHDRRSKDLVKTVIQAIGLPKRETHFDLPKPRTSFPQGHLTTGIAYAFPWHRDTWYAAPRQQINWWLPIFDVLPQNSMMFDLDRFGVTLSNTSDSFDYYEINRARLTTAAQVKQETQSRPSAVGHQASQPLVVVAAPGSVLLFSGAQLHASVPNTTTRSRYSIDFRTVDRRDVARDVGAELVDSHCTGTALRDFVNVDTGNRFDEAFVRTFYGDPPEDALLVFQGPTQQQHADVSEH